LSSKGVFPITVLLRKTLAVGEEIILSLPYSFCLSKIKNRMETKAINNKTNTNSRDNLFFIDSINSL